MALTPELRKGIDQIRNYLFGGGYPDPMSNAEQLSFFFFFYLIEGLDYDNQLRAKAKKQEYVSMFAGKWNVVNPLNSPDKKSLSIPAEHLRWSVWAKGMTGETLVRFVRDEVFSFYTSVADKSAMNFMDGARLGIDEPTVLTQIIGLIDNLRLDQADSDTKGDLFEYVLKQIKQAGELGQFRTPRHLIRALVEMVDPMVGETIYDPAAGTAGFLVSAYNHIRLANSSSNAIEDVELDGKLVRRGWGDKLNSSQNSLLATNTFFGNDVDPKMVRLATMNLTLRGLPNVHILKRNALTTAIDKTEKSELGLPLDGYDVVLANPPFSGSVDKDRIVDDVKVGSTTATEVLFLKYILNSIKNGGRCGIIIPEGVLRGPSQSHLEMRRQLLSNNTIEAIIGLPHASFKPYASVATFMVIFKKGGSTKKIWMAHIDDDGYTPNSLREPIESDDIPEILAAWKIAKTDSYIPVPRKHSWVSRELIEDDELCLVPRVYLRSQNLDSQFPFVSLGELFNITKGKSSASKTLAGNLPLITTGEKWKSCNKADFNGPAICIPLVSSTGHGHASIKWIHYVSGPFSAATIVSVLTPKDTSIVSTRYVHYILSIFKDDILVPMMVGAANVSLSVEKISSLKIPLPKLLQEQEEIIKGVDSIRFEIDSMKEKMETLVVDYSDEIAEFKALFSTS
jgi:type I restriction enzyme M protein